MATPSLMEELRKNKISKLDADMQDVVRPRRVFNLTKNEQIQLQRDIAQGQKLKEESNTSMLSRWGADKGWDGEPKKTSAELDKGNAAYDLIYGGGDDMFRSMDNPQRPGRSISDPSVGQPLSDSTKEALIPALYTPIGMENRTTVGIDGGSVTVPKELLASTFSSLGAGPTNAQVLESQGIERGTPEFNRIMAGEPKPTAPSMAREATTGMSTEAQLSPQRNFERRVATGQALTGREQEQAREFAASMGYEFSPTAGYIKPTMSMAAATKLTGGNRDAARGMIEQQRQGFNPLTKKTFEREAQERAAFEMQQEGFERGQERADTQLGLSQTAAQRQSERDKASDAFRERELALREDQERRLSASVSGQSERVQRQERLQKELGLSPAQALSVIEGVERIVTDPNTGQTIVYNQGTGESRELDLSPSLSAEIQKLSEPQPSQGGGLYGLVNEDITGIVPGFLEKLQGVTGSLPGVSFDVVDPEATEGRQQLRIAMQTLGRALAENPRFSEGEQQRIRKEIDIKPSVFSDPQTLRARMRAINSALEGRIDNYLEVASSSATPTSGKRDAINKITTIRNFLDDLGVPSDEKNGGGFQLSPEAQEAMKLYGH